MSFRPCASLVLALVLSACASSAGTSFGGGSEDTLRASGGNSRLIVRAQLAAMEGRTALDAVERYNRRWLTPQRGATVSGGLIYVRVVVDGVQRGERSELLRLGTEDVESMRLLSSADATTKYGTGYLGGVIEVTMRRGR